ncbi:hypothetical protein BV25DRAFT_1836303 [Artomyces pyxidatus]|uniref:Uncharacterized protein n=1 Tax=Artomyces pyxidatus TaxID=48021 RepID=A0ACB8TBV4_9AGAM|nr:hypothetical protein BV25DRAFT_1836303 [Artomyces pyxidatus]
MQKFAVALFAFLAVLALVLPASARVTNADRLRRGQPPLPPTRRATAKRQAPSPSSPQSISGRIQVRDATGLNTLGYIQNTVSGPTGIKFSGSENDLEVLYVGAELVAYSAIFPSPFLIGASGSALLSVGSAAAIPFINVDESISAIWSLDVTTGALTATWKNIDGSILNPVFAYDSVQDKLFLTGDIIEFAAAALTEATPPVLVSLYLVA